MCVWACAIYLNIFFFYSGKAKLASVPTGAAVVASGGGAAAPAATEEKSGNDMVYL